LKGERCKSGISPRLKTKSEKLTFDVILDTITCNKIKSGTSKDHLKSFMHDANLLSGGYKISV